MTTIACDGRTVAADSQVTCGTRRLAGSEPKLHARGGYVFGICGAVSPFNHLIQWWFAGADPATYPKFEYEFTFIVFFRDCVYILDEKCGHKLDRREYPTVFGSGGDIAMGALLAGASPARAVEIATSIDVMSGMPVQAMTVPDLDADKAWPAPAPTVAKKQIRRRRIR